MNSSPVKKDNREDIDFLFKESYEADYEGALETLDFFLNIFDYVEDKCKRAYCYCADELRFTLDAYFPNRR
jgi:hypothetical protein